MNYAQFQPSPALQRYVRYFWTLESNSQHGSPKTFRPLADGCPGLLFQPAQLGTWRDQTNKSLPELLLYGQTIRHRELHTGGAVRVVGACFYPHALKLIFGLDADELTDDCTDLAALTRDAFLTEQLAEAPSANHQIDQLSCFLLAQVRKNRAQTDHQTEYVMDQLLRSNGSVSLKELQDFVNLSERSVQRRFKQWVGISPKLFSRVCRFQASLQQLRTNSYDKLSDIAFEQGYADQSHFIRGFKEFAGFSPLHYRTQASEPVENLTEWTV